MRPLVPRLFELRKPPADCRHARFKCRRDLRVAFTVSHHLGDCKDLLLREVSSHVYTCYFLLLSDNIVYPITFALILQCRFDVETLFHAMLVTAFAQSKALIASSSSVRLVLALCRSTIVASHILDSSILIIPHPMHFLSLLCLLG